MNVKKILNERGYPVGYYNGMGWKLLKGRYFIFVDGNLDKKFLMGKRLDIVPIGIVKVEDEYVIYAEVPGVVEYVFVDGDIENYMEVIDVDIKNAIRAGSSRRTSKRKIQVNDNKED